MEKCPTYSLETSPEMNQKWVADGQFYVKLFKAWHV